ncbi:MAG TPA: class I SAM-dependent methyltransferase [Thermoplasmata archaeon]|nr:class I SAM-dependent methyltransferase [Thermoplasmata archaeon]
MPEMTGIEKFFVNRRGSRSYVRMLDRVERAGELPLDPSSQVLELGAGNGMLSALIHERYHPARIHVTDYDPEQVRLAQTSLERRLGTLPSSFVIERGDAERLAYADATFDLVIAHEVLHHLGSIEHIFGGLDEIARVLRSSGRLLYVETFHKRRIREHLTDRGFSIVFHERALRIFSSADVVIGVRRAADPSPARPEG